MFRCCGNKMGCSDFNMKLDVVCLYKVGGSSDSKIGMQYGLTTIVHHFEGQ
jgi:hypothetical protein